MMFPVLSAIFAFFTKKEKKAVLGQKNRRIIFYAWENMPLVICEVFEIKTWQL